MTSVLETYERILEALFFVRNEIFLPCGVVGGLQVPHPDLWCRLSHGLARGLRQGAYLPASMAHCGRRPWGGPQLDLQA